MELPFPEMGKAAGKQVWGGWEIRNFDHVTLEMPLIPANGGLAAPAAGHVVWAGNTALGITRVETGLNALGLDKIPQQVSVASKGTPALSPKEHRD